jgi:hypothetical protein
MLCERIDMLTKESSRCLRVESILAKFMEIWMATALIVSSKPAEGCTAILMEPRLGQELWCRLRKPGECKFPQKEYAKDHKELKTALKFWGS